MAMLKFPKKVYIIALIALSILLYLFVPGVATLVNFGAWLAGGVAGWMLRPIFKKPKQVIVFGIGVLVFRFMFVWIPLAGPIIYNGLLGAITFLGAWSIYAQLSAKKEE
jgi:hypothetical protein